MFNHISTVFGVPFLERALALRVKACEVNTAGTAQFRLFTFVRLFHAKNFVRLEILYCIKLFYFGYSMDIEVGLAKIMHRTNIYLPHKTPEGKLLNFWNMSSNFRKPPNNQTNFFEDVK